MPIEFAVLKKEGIEETTTFVTVENIAAQLRLHLDGEDAQQLILERVSSQTGAVGGRS